MKKAKTLSELKRNLNPDYRPTIDDKNIYVPIYKHVLADLQEQLLDSEIINQTILVTGQTGTGKSTALEHLKTDKQITDCYKILHADMSELLDFSDTDIVDVLLAIGFVLTSDNSTLQKKYFKKLDELQKIHKGGLFIEKSNSSSHGLNGGINTELSGGIKFLNFIKAGAKVFAEYHADSECRRTAREVFNAKKESLKQLIDNIIADYYIEYKLGDGKELLLIIDDIEKMDKPENIRALFDDNFSYFFGIKCRKIISVPIPASTFSKLTNNYSPIHRFILKMKKNPLDKIDKKPDEIIERNKQLLKKIIYKRVEKELIEESAIDVAINMSGGILRQFIKILLTATSKCRINDGKQVSKNNVEEAWCEHRKTLDATVISTTLINMLDNVRKNNKPDVENDLFVKALQTNQIVAYTNGVLWYEVNPLIEKTVEIYASR